MIDKTADMIKRHEGYRGAIYEDTVGVLTVGWGSSLQIGKEVPAHICERLFWLDYKAAVDGYESLGLVLDYERRAVCIDMIFNLGLRGFREFKKTLGYIRAEEWDKAADEMLKSKWSRQVGNRAEELSDIMRFGIMV